MNYFEEILSYLPRPPAWEIDWAGLRQTALSPLFAKMEQTQQNPDYHKEGNVYEHTKMVCDALAALPAFRALEGRKQQEVFIAALLHDVGKIRTTRWEEERWVSPNHSAAGCQMAREFLWLECGLCGTPKKQQFRETVCCLVRCHMVPGHVFEQKNLDLRLRQMASAGEQAPDFTIDLLCLLSEADARGRIVSDCPETDGHAAEALEKVLLCAEAAAEAGCQNGPPGFASDCVKRAYFSERNVFPEQDFYDDAWGEVILMSGLPGTGKDTWIAKNYAGLPVVSLDAIRKEQNVCPSKGQGKVIQAAREQARAYLRRKQPFVWNATNLTDILRKKQVDLFEQYHAAVRIVYLETNWKEQLSRNAGRQAAVPEARVYEMLQTLAPPMPWEARSVEWHCI